MEIFLGCSGVSGWLPVHTGCRRVADKTSKRRSNEMGISQVCWRWREIALSTPKMWSAIWVTTHTPLMRIATWLYRGAETRISINWNSWENIQVIQRQIATLETHFNRVVELNLVILNQKTSSTVSYVHRDLVLRLCIDFHICRFSVLSNYNPIGAPAPSLPFAWTRLDNLKSIFVYGNYFTWKHVHLHNLRALHLHSTTYDSGPSWAQLREVLSASASTLEDLSMVGCGFRRGDPGDFARLHNAIFPALKTIQFWTLDSTTENNLLKSIQAPNLHALALASNDKASSDPLRIFLRHAVSLQSLWLVVRFTSNEQDDFSWVHDHSVPDLRRLWISPCEAANRYQRLHSTVIRALGQYNHLQVISLWHLDGAQDAFMDMVEQRQESEVGRPLRTIYLSTVPLELRTRLGDLRVEVGQLPASHPWQDLYNEDMNWTVG